MVRIHPAPQKEINKMAEDNNALIPRPYQEVVGDIGISVERQQELVGAAARMLDVLFQGRDLGTTKGPVLGQVWPWVRYLVWDSLKPKLGQGISMYNDVKWKDNDKFLNDLSTLAKRVAQVVPERIDGNEWRFIALATYDQLLERVDPQQQQQIVMQSLMRGPGDEQFETSFNSWAEIIEGEAREVK